MLKNLDSLIESIENSKLINTIERSLEKNLTKITGHNCSYLFQTQSFSYLYRQNKKNKSNVIYVDFKNKKRIS